MHFLLTGGTLNPLKDEYAKALAIYGHTSDVLYPGDTYPDVSSYDALLLPGGGDIHPQRFNMPPLDNNSEVLDEARDQWEFSLFDDFFREEKPILGICRGMQVINVALGGTIWQDLPSQRGLIHSNPPDEPPMTHEVAFSDGRKLEVNSYHHQAVNRIGRGLHVTARSHDGVAEALTHETRPIRAVQWHPEKTERGLSYLMLILRIK